MSYTHDYAVQHSSRIGLAAQDPQEAELRRSPSFPSCGSPVER